MKNINQNQQILPIDSIWNKSPTIKKPAVQQPPELKLNPCEYHVNMLHKVKVLKN